MKRLGFLVVAAILLLLAACGQIQTPEGQLDTLDNTVTDGDGVTPVASNDLNFGDVCPGTTTGKSALVAISRNGSSTGTNTFKDSAAVTISVLSTSGTGLSATVPASPNNQIILPSNWTSLQNNTLSNNSVSSDVKLVAPMTTGTFTGTVTYRASGQNTSNATINRDDTMSVRANVLAATHANCVTTPSDSTAPEISYTLNPPSPDGDNGWYKSSVTLTWTVTENESPSSLSKVECDDQNITADQKEAKYSCSATSDGGSASPVEVKIKRDATQPTLSPSVSPNPVLLNGNPTASSGAFDATSGLFSESCDAVDTSSVGSKTVTCYAKDNAGNTNSASVNYSVKYGFNGGNILPSERRVYKAGSSVPVDWQYTNASGAVVASAGANPTVQFIKVACDTGDEMVSGTADDAGSSGIRYIEDTSTWRFNWKTAKTTTGCFNIKVTSGQSGQADTFLGQVQINK